jgi:hypothetical protein
MALMGRALDIPSRVAVGFLKPAPQEDGSYVYSAHDMHAWPEMYFEGTGWVRFEPTPGGRSGDVPRYTRERIERDTPSASASASALTPSQNRFDEPSAAPTGGTDTGSGTWNATMMFAGAGAALLAVALVLAPRTARSWVRRRRWEAAGTAPALAEAAWSELRDDALDLGVAWDDRVTLRTRARDLVRGFGLPGADDDALGRSATRGPGANPGAEAALARIVDLLEHARFAREMPATAPQRTALQEDVATCRAALEAGVSRRRQTRATWLPASLWSRWLSGAARRRARTDTVLGEPGVDRAV